MANIGGTYTSPYTSPTFKYDLSYRQTGRTASSVTYEFTVSAYMTHSGSWFGYTLNAYLNVGGKEVLVFSKPASQRWTGTTKHTYKKSITCSTDSNAGTVSARFWTTTPDSPGNSGKINVSGTFNKTSGSGGVNPPSLSGFIFKKVNGNWKDYCEFEGIKKKVNGAWQNGQVMRKNGGKWIQIYPGSTTGGGGGTSTDGYVVITGGTHKWKNKYDWRADGTARQGTWASYGAAYGVFGITRQQFKGSGAVTNVKRAYITGKRNASGYYNNNQTIRFYRSNNSGSGSSIGYAGQFTATTGAPGADRWMVGNRTISGMGNLKDFLNGVGGYNNLLIHSSANADYLGLSNVKLAVDYEYRVTRAIFANPLELRAMPMEALYEKNMKNPYHEMFIYEDEMDMSLEEIIDRRTNLNIPDIDPNSVIPVEPTSLPYSGHFEVKNGKFYVKLFNIFESRKPEVSFDGETWGELKFNPLDNEYSYDLPISYNDIQIRVVDETKDELLFEHTFDKPRVFLT